MKRLVRKTLKWTLIVFSVFFVLFLMQITALAYPQPLFDHNVQYGSFVFYSDAPIDSGLDQSLREVEVRLVGTELYDHTITQHIFVCQKQSTYNIFRRLTFVPAHVPGFNISLLDNSFVSATLLNRRSQDNYAGITYSAIAGDIAQCISHELVHDYAVARSGFFANRGLPRWKTEGYAEYAASIALIRDDSTATLSSRIETLQSAFQDARPYEYYRGHLVVEYLAEYEGYSYDEIMADDVTLDDAYRRMMLWHGKGRTAPI